MTKEPQFEHSTKHWPIKHPDECVLPEIMGPLAPFDSYNYKDLLDTCHVVYHSYHSNEMQCREKRNSRVYLFGVHVRCLWLINETNIDKISKWYFLCFWYLNQHPFRFLLIESLLETTCISRIHCLWDQFSSLSTLVSETWWFIFKIDLNVFLKQPVKSKCFRHCQ